VAGKFLYHFGFTLAFVLLNVKSRIHPAADFTSIHSCVMDMLIEIEIKINSKHW
jgi:hypothetical protein